MSLVQSSQLSLTTVLLTISFLHGRPISAYECTTQKFTSSSGIIQSPEYPKEYPHNVACHYTIVGNENDVIEIAFGTFHTERPCKGIMKDYLKITDGQNGDNVQMLYLLGALNMPYHFKSQTNIVKLAFVSDESISYSGFEAEYLVHGSTKRYPTKRLNDLTGEIKSPGYPKFKYPNGVTCDYIIRAKKGYHIEITFDIIEIESQINGRRTDYLKIQDGKLTDKTAGVHYLNGTMRTPFKYTGKNTRLILRFVTNDRIRMRGFHAFYKQVKDPVYCTRLSILYGSSNCTETSDKGLYSECRVVCDLHFLLLGNEMAHCNNGIYVDIPKCIPDLESAEICAKNISDPECPFLPATVAEYFSEYAMAKPTDRETDETFFALFDDVGDVLGTLDSTTPNVVNIQIRMENNVTNTSQHENTPKESIQSTNKIGRSPVKQWKCPPFLCKYSKKNKKFLYNCQHFANKLQMAFKLTHKQKKQKMIQCFTCQSNNCGTPVSIFS